MKYAHLSKLGNDAIFAALRRNDFSRVRAAHELGASIDCLRVHVRRLKTIGYKIPADPALKPVGFTEYTPTPEEIQRECARFRAEWSDVEEAHRRVIKQREYSFPRVGDLLYG